MMLLPRARILLAIGLVTAGSACAVSPHSQSDTTAASSTSSSTASSSDGFARLGLEYEMPAVVGGAVRVSATGLPAGKTAELTWGTVEGGWVVEDYYHFRGKKYSETTTSLGQFGIDASGALNARFDVPEDFGGVHEVSAVVDGKVVAQNGINVTQTFALSPTSGPVGTPLELKITGLGWRTMESTWVVNWDNQQLGFVTAAGTRGSGVARFRASGPPGRHTVKLYTGWQAQAYLNYEQSPVADLPRPQFTFTTTAGSTGSPAYAEPYKPQPLPKNDVLVSGATLALQPTQGPVGTRAVLKATGLTPGERVRVSWQTSVGSRVSGNGFAAEDHALGDMLIGPDGTGEWPLTIPEDLGGLHALTLMRGAGVIATAHFAIETSIVDMTPRSGPAGTPVSIHLKGVGWTEYDNIYVATYDNAYMGYACGFNSQGDVVINFTAAGAPGTHLIDLYPGIYQGPATEPQQLYRQPQLTYADDHPGNIIPALRFMFEVTAEPKPAAAVRTDE